jgi:hypothetical protein
MSVDRPENVHEILERMGPAIEELYERRDPHRLALDHNPDVDYGYPPEKQVPNYGVRESQKVLNIKGRPWIPKGREDNCPPGVDPAKWATLPRKERRRFARRASR